MSPVLYFFAVTLFQTGLADFETRLMGIPSDNTFTLTVIMTVVSLLLYLPVNRLAPRIGKKKLIIVGFFTYAFVFFLASICGNWFPGIVWGILIAVCAGVPMAILGILPQACVADVAEVEALKTGENRSGMFFAARTFAFKLGQSIAMLLVTAFATIGQDTGLGYRITAIAAAAVCILGGVLFMLYDEKKVYARIMK